MRKVKHILTRNHLLTLYYSLVYPYIDYGITLSGTSHKTHTNRIFIMQKKAIRIIAGAKYNANPLNAKPTYEYDNPKQYWPYS